MDTAPRTPRLTGPAPRSPRDAAAMSEIDDARRTAGLTMQVVAERLGVSRQFVHQMLRCARPCPPETYRALRSVVGLALALVLVACGAEPEPVADPCPDPCPAWLADPWLAVVPGVECQLELAPWSPDVDDLGGEVCE